MAILTFNGTGFHVDGSLEPVEFWPYATYVENPILEIQRYVMAVEGLPYKTNSVELLLHWFVEWFRAAGIRVSADNKIVFGLRDLDNKMWYIGFKDGSVKLGTSIHGDRTIPITRP